MNKSDISYIITIVFFAIGFIGFAVNAGFAFTWFIAIGFGIIIFIGRTIAGHD